MRAISNEPDLRIGTRAIVTLLRSILFHLWFVLVSVVIFIGAVPLFLGPRVAVIRAAQFWSHAVLWGLKIICGQTFEVRGREHIPQGGALIASKHYSMWETIAFMVLTDDPAIVLKRNLMWIPFYGWYGLKMEMIPIDRLGKSRALRAMRRAARTAIAKGRQIVVFPEGTRRKVGAPPVYKPGVAGLYAELSVPCVPAAHNSALFWQGLIRKPGMIVVEFLPPIPPGLRRAEFMRELETRIEGAVERLVPDGKREP